MMCCAVGYLASTQSLLIGNSNYTELNSLYEKYKEEGLEILAFPCNQFGDEEPGSNDQIKEFVCSRFKSEFSIFGKVEVNGENAAPLYKFLKSGKALSNKNESGGREHGRLCSDHVPEVYHFDQTMSLIGMRYLEPPHIILRKGLIAGVKYPLLAPHMSEYMARTLFFTSLLYNTTTDHKRAVAEFCGNVELCRLTEQVVFSDPYKVSEYNRWTSPFLDEDAVAVREDNDLKLEVAELKSMFCERAQALIHGDLHTVSVMVTEDSTQVIDPDFSFYGPMGLILEPS